MGVEGVGRPLDVVEGERDTLRPARLLQLCIEGQRTFPTSEFGGAVFLAIHSRFWHLRVELERMPLHPHVVPTGQSDGLLQSPLTDVAPRTNNIGDHVNLDRHGYSPQTMLGF